MLVAIIGSREIYGYGLDELISHIPQNASELVSGGAAGVDALAEQAAGRLGLPIRVFRPDYDRDGRFAPLVRNSEIVGYADLVLAFWDGRSRGTADTLRKCVETSTPFRIIHIP